MGWQQGKALLAMNHLCGGCQGLPSGHAPVWLHLGFAAFWVGCRSDGLQQALLHGSAVLFLEGYR